MGKKPVGLSFFPFPNQTWKYVLFMSVFHDESTLVGRGWKVNWWRFHVICDGFFEQTAPPVWKSTLSKINIYPKSSVRNKSFLVHIWFILLINILNTKIFQALFVILSTMHTALECEENDRCKKRGSLRVFSHKNLWGNLSPTTLKLPSLTSLTQSFEPPALKVLT